MQWFRRNAVGLFALTLAAVAFTSGAEAYRSGIRRDEQARAIPRRLERGEADLAEQHRKSVIALSSYADVTRSVAYTLAGLAAAAWVMHAIRSQPSLRLAAVIAVLAVAAVLLALESRTD